MTNNDTIIIKSRAGAPSHLNLISYFIRLGAVGFGGPVALANRMRADLVERDGWLSEAEYNEGLAIATACPGPLAYQLAVYCGFILKGLSGAIGVAVAFAFAPFCIAALCGYLYMRFGAAAKFQAAFIGIAPVIVALVGKASYQIACKTLTKQWTAIAVCVVACAMTVVVRQELAALFIIAGVIGCFLLRPNNDVGSSGKEHVPKWIVLSALVMGSFICFLAVIDIATLHTSLLLKLFLFFFRTGMMIFGSGLVIVPFLKQYVVDQFHWLSQQTFLDSVAVGIVSPGPVVITATFVGYLLSGTMGALVATVGIFCPSVLFTVIGTPLLRAYRQNRYVQGFIKGIAVAVVGVLVGTSVLLAISSLKDWLTVVIAGACMICVLKFPKVPEQGLIVAGGILGLLFETRM